jgi:hypothetical protein
LKEETMADVLQQGQHAARPQHVRHEGGLGRPFLFAIAFALAGLGLAVSGYLLVAAVPALFSVVAVLAAFRVMG